jgi:AcrR family transcriptional regulator
MTNEITTTKLNKHELRTRETRELLLHAAREIFVRDGYEGAELGEIAALAGRTKGAIYAQFKSKEDIFLAMFEERTLYHRAQMKANLAKSTGVERNMATVREFSLKLAEDREWSLLFLEFKLFAIRHPESAKRMQSFYAGIFSANQEKQLSELLGSAGKGKEAISRVVAVKVLQPMLSALVLEAKFEPAFLGEDVVRKVAGRIFDALFQTPQQ